MTTLVFPLQYVTAAAKAFFVKLTNFEINFPLLFLADRHAFSIALSKKEVIIGVFNQLSGSNPFSY